MLQFLLTFAILSIIGSAAIIGFYICTRGEYRLTPDGKYKKEGMIFKWWSLFFEQYKKTKKVYYSGKGLEEKYELLKKVFPNIASKMKVSADCLYGLIVNEQLTDNDKKVISDCLLCDVEIFNGQVFLCIREPVYDFPEWVQKPLSSCPTCFSGPYGSAIWLAFLKLQRDAFAWTDSPVFAYIVFGMIFLLTLSTINTILSHKLKL